MDRPPSLAVRPHRLAPRPLPAEDAPDGLVDLVARAKHGDREAYTVLYRRYLDEVYRYALLRLDTREAAEDATQTIFVRALASLPTCREEAAFVGWLFVIARGVVADQLRARRRFTEAIADDAPWPDARPGPHEIAERGEATRVLQAARQRCLSERERELFDLLLTEMNDKQIAVALGRSHGAVRTAHWRLLSKLRACLGSPSGPTAKGSAHA